MNGAAAAVRGVAGLVLVALIGWIDLVTGRDYGTSLLYLVPISWAAWRIGSWWAAAAVVVATGFWLAAELLAHPGPPYAPVVWNGFTRLIIFSAVAGLIVRLREDHLQLERLNRSLRESLEAQTLLAGTDSLTGLPNSRSFTDELARRIERTRHTRDPLCLAYIDIDNFKELNDRHGHLAGDEALRRVADVLRSAVRSDSGGREGDLVARLGGDEFGILFSSVESEAALAIAERVIARVRDLGEDYPEAGLAASIGIASTRRTEGDADDLIRRADRAMYRSKQEGKGRVVIEA
ncbi:MAG TPA: GGDEF domain-containing protein [Thermoanaerobaculia bacterium]|nr:GGDEF domain-containing protein [Thermoanaerobaculia bacterium]